jgi:hypothetical protein
VFGVIRPKLVVFTTPNSEFNVRFGPDFEGPFRHWDHKFEWTRMEFADWCGEITDKYDDYVVRYDGVGYCGDQMDIDDLGPCSQIAVFTRKDFLERVNNGETIDPPPAEDVEHKLIGDYADGNFTAKMLHSWTIPKKLEDARSPEEIAHDEVLYYARQYAFSSDEWAEGETARIFIADLMVHKRVQDLDRTEEDIG